MLSRGIVGSNLGGAFFLSRCIFLFKMHDSADLGSPAYLQGGRRAGGLALCLQSRVALLLWAPKRKRLIGSLAR